MSKKKDRAWFVCPQWTALIAQHYPMMSLRRALCGRTSRY
jgi:hypothetical protein